tara:strand:+ start:1413 stop:1796 length:384 start_codon:yes stop_codon:yes gene_type:complete
LLPYGGHVGGSIHSHKSQSKILPSPQFTVGPYGHPQFVTGHGQAVVVVVLVVVDVVVVVVCVVVLVNGGRVVPSLHSQSTQSKYLPAGQKRKGPQPGPQLAKGQGHAVVVVEEVVVGGSGHSIFAQV